MVQKLFWLLILRHKCRATTEEFAPRVKPAKTATKWYAEAVDDISNRPPQLTRAIRAGGAADAAEAGDGRR